MLSLYNSGMQGIAVVVFLCSMAVPLMKLLCQLAVLLCIAIDRAKPVGLLLYRFYHHLREWGCSRSICSESGFHHQAA